MSAQPVAERNWRRIADFTDDECCVFHERHYGWEKASCRQLADIFQTTPQTISAILSREM